MLESNKQRSERKKREATILKQLVASRFAPHCVPFKDEIIASNVVFAPISNLTESVIS